MIRRIFLFFITAFISFAASGQNLREVFYRAYITGDMVLWEKLLTETDLLSMTPAIRYEFAMAHYGFIGYCLGRDQKQKARPFLDKVELLAEELLMDSPGDPRYLALRGALYGFRINYQPQKSPIIGPRALKKVNQALEAGPECPQAWIEAGNKDWWMPEIFGGSRVRAISEYEKAIRLMEQDPPSLQKNWYYLNMNMILAAWYEERGRTFAAREIYRKLIEFEPDFTWALEKLR